MHSHLYLSDRVLLDAPFFQPALLHFSGKVISGTESMAANDLISRSLFGSSARSQSVVRSSSNHCCCFGCWLLLLVSASFTTCSCQSQNRSSSGGGWGGISMEGSKGSQHDVLLLYIFFCFFVLRADLSFMVSSLSPPLLSLGSSSSFFFFISWQQVVVLLLPYTLPTSISP